jgi:hypothetical protein
MGKCECGGGGRKKRNSQPQQCNDSRNEFYIRVNGNSCRICTDELFWVFFNSSALSLDGAVMSR